jgi:dienelactone hydrolase
MARLALTSHGRRPRQGPAVVVLHEVFGVNADIRKTRDELAEKILCNLFGELQY